MPKIWMERESIDGLMERTNRRLIGMWGVLKTLCSSKTSRRYGNAGKLGLSLLLIPFDNVG